MAKAKKPKKATVKIKDLEAKADPKGGLNCVKGEHIKDGQINP